MREYQKSDNIPWILAQCASVKERRQGKNLTK